MATFKTTTGVGVSIVRNGEWVHSMLPVIDTNWVWVDAAGHEHRGDDLNATTKEQWLRGQWCDMCLESHDHFMRYFCKTCRETVEPGTRPADPVWVPGLTEGSMTLPTDGGLMQTWSLSGRALDALIAMDSEQIRTLDIDTARAILGDDCYLMNEYMA
jgi:hypothetical protein